MFGLGINHALRGVLPEAMAFAERTYSLVPWSTNAIGLLAGVLALSGDRNRAEELLQKLGDGRAYGAPWGFVIFHLLCSETDRAVDWLEKGVEQRDPRLGPFLGLFGKVLRSSSRWPVLARQINLWEAVA